MLFCPPHQLSSLLTSVGFKASFKPYWVEQRDQLNPTATLVSIFDITSSIPDTVPSTLVVVHVRVSYCSYHTVAL